MHHAVYICVYIAPSTETSNSTVPASTSQGFNRWSYHWLVTYIIILN